MINNILDMFSYSFIIRALIVGILISISSSLIGTSLVLRRNSMIGDGLSHVAFLSFAISTVFGFAPVEFSLIVVVIISFLILRLNDNKVIHNDSSIALISSSSLALGTFLISTFKGVNQDLNSYLFGSILSVSEKDVILSIILTIFVVAIFILSYNKIFAITFDETFAKSVGINTNFYNMLFSVLCSVTIVIGMRLLGSLLISSLLIFPSLSMMLYFKTFKKVVIGSVITSFITFIIGFILSYFLESPTGSTIVLVNLVIFLLFYMISYIKEVRVKC